MKNTFKLFGNRQPSRRAAKVPLLIIALAAIIGFSFSACGDGDGGGDNGGGGGGGSATLGETPTLSGKVYVYTQNEQSYTITFPEYKGGNLTVSDYGLEETGTISNGQFSFTLGQPLYLETLSESNLEYFFRGYTELTASSSSVQGYRLTYFDIDNSSKYYGLARENATVSRSGTSGSITYESVMYVYVDSDVTVSGEGDTDIDDEDEGFIWTSTTKDFRLALKAGWNTVYTKRTMSSKLSGTTMTMTETEAISLSNPTSLKWALQESYYDDYDDYDFNLDRLLSITPKHGSLRLKTLRR
jgi:hypothetical protein